MFSALYSAVYDFILVIIPWKQIFNLQMKRSERFGLAVALSMGILAGITGIMKAVEGYILMDVTTLEYIYHQSVYWVWSQAEPNMTIISASILVLRGFVRSKQKERSSSKGARAYIKTTNSSNRFYIETARAAAKYPDPDSDRSILSKNT